MGSDSIVTLLLREHAEMSRQLDDFSQGASSTWPERLAKLVDTVIRHETAEEMVLYPLVRLEPGGAAIADARLAEQAEIAELVSQFEMMDTTSGEFAESFEILRGAILEHASSEELFVFPMLQEEVQEVLLSDIGRRYQEVRDLVPEQDGQSATQIAESIRAAAPDLRRRSVDARPPPTDERQQQPRRGSPALRS